MANYFDYSTLEDELLYDGIKIDLLDYREVTRSLKMGQARSCIKAVPIPKQSPLPSEGWGGEPNPLILVYILF